MTEPTYLARVPPNYERDKYGTPVNCTKCRHRRGCACAVYITQRPGCLTYRLEMSRAFSDAPHDGGRKAHHS